jgi:hypothetical protein
MKNKPSGINDLANDDPFQKELRLKNEDYSAARRALYAAKAQLGLKKRVFN